MTRAFHVLVSLLVAVPLGAGGLCCCLLGPADSEVGSVEQEPVHSCCPAEAGPIESDSSCPVDDGEQDCECPSRDTALLAGVTGGKLFPLPAPANDVVAPQNVDEVIYSAEELPRGSGVPHPPPKKPLYRTLSVLLC